MYNESEIQIRQILQDDKKQQISRCILEALPEWFEIEETREGYIQDSHGKLFFAAFENNKPAGFLYLKETGKATVEIAVMGVLKEYHRQGVGRKLFESAKECAVKNCYEFMQVKTVQYGVYEDYDKTNLFYKSLGFKEFEVFPLLWDKDNPCQVYVMAL